MAAVDSTSNAVLVPILPPQELAKPTPLDITVGHALPSEATAIAKIGTDTFTAAFAYAIPTADLAEYLAATYSEVVVPADMKDSTVQTWVARDSSGKVWGFVQLVRGLSEPCVPGDPATHAELRRLYIDTTAHGRGIGSKLVAAVEEQARAEGFKQLWLMVWDGNASAERLYLRLGYQRCGTIPFRIGGSRFTGYALSKSL
ncbi:acyl-CoA N-acyltransferase [Xylaria sp. FL1777]|nr:acyl-CoA N-acyltransferase [Xylaria sp. FL1777]